MNWLYRLTDYDPGQCFKLFAILGVFTYVRFACSSQFRLILDDN